MSEESTVVLPSEQIQVGIVVKDVKKTSEFFSSILGIGPWKIRERAFTTDEMKVGQPFKILQGIAYWGALEIELIQPLEGNRMYSDFLETKGEGLHHLRTRVKNLGENVSKLEKAGIKVIMRGWKENEGIGMAYMDTTKIGGVIFEISEKI